MSNRTSAHHHLQGGRVCSSLQRKSGVSEAMISLQESDHRRTAMRRAAGPRLDRGAAWLLLSWCSPPFVRTRLEGVRKLLIFGWYWTLHWGPESSRKLRGRCWAARARRQGQGGRRTSWVGEQLKLGTRPATGAACAAPEIGVACHKPQCTTTIELTIFWGVYFAFSGKCPNFSHLELTRNRRLLHYVGKAPMPC